MQFDFSKTHQFIQLLLKDWTESNGENVHLSKFYNFSKYFRELEQARILWKQEYHETYVTTEFRRYARFLINEITEGVEQIQKKISMIPTEENQSQSEYELFQLYTFQIEQLNFLSIIIERDRKVRMNSDSLGYFDQTPKNSVLIQQDLPLNKLIFRIKQVDVFALLWLLREAKLIRKITNNDLANFAKNAFEFTKQGAPAEMKDVSNALSKLGNKEIENFQQEELKCLRLAFDSLNESLNQMELNYTENKRHNNG